MLVPLVAILIALPDLGLTLQRFRAPLPAALETFRRDPNFVAGAYPDALAYLQFSKALVESYSAIAAVVPKGECVWSIKPTLVGYYAGRRALAPPRAELGDEDFDIALRQGGCRYLLMLNVVSPTYGVPFYPLQRVKDRITIHWSSLRQADDQGPMLALIGELR